MNGQDPFSGVAASTYQTGQNLDTNATHAAIATGTNLANARPNILGGLQLLNQVQQQKSELGFKQATALTELLNGTARIMASDDTGTALPSFAPVIQRVIGNLVGDATTGPKIPVGPDHYAQLLTPGGFGDFSDYALAKQKQQLAAAGAETFKNAVPVPPTADVFVNPNVWNASVDMPEMASQTTVTQPMASTDTEAQRRWIEKRNTIGLLQGLPMVSKHGIEYGTRAPLSEPIETSQGAISEVMTGPDGRLVGVPVPPALHAVAGGIMSVKLTGASSFMPTQNFPLNLQHTILGNGNIGAFDPSNGQVIDTGVKGVTNDERNKVLTLAKDWESHHPERADDPNFHDDAMAWAHEISYAGNPIELPIQIGVDERGRPKYAEDRGGTIVKMPHKAVWDRELQKTVLEPMTIRGQSAAPSTSTSTQTKNGNTILRLQVR